MHGDRLDARLRESLRPDEDLAFIVGMDVLHELPLWREPRRVLELARMIAISRPGQQTLAPDELERRLPGASARVTIIETPGVAISSTELRCRVTEDKPIRYMVPDGVAAYIRKHHLYR